MKAGLIGEKLSHSHSPAIHRRFYRLAGIEGSYALLETDAGSLGKLLDRLESEGFSGVNVTIPYKTEIMKHLDALSDEARAIGAVNTVRFSGGKRIGYNTDYYGLKVMLGSAGMQLNGAVVAILGTGGAARCVLKLAGDLGAARIFAVSRNPENAGKAFNAVSYAELSAAARIDVLINTTPVGMYPHTDACPVTPDVIKKCGAVADLIYNPAETLLLAQARLNGIKAVNGLPMLCAQAIAAQEVWNGVKYSAEIYSAVYNYMKTKAYKTNIVLIGMPGSGKTTVGQLLAETLGMEFADTDTMVEQAHAPIPDIFRLEGEPKFRSYEHDAAVAAAAMANAVISTGGGMILDKSNMDILRATGTIVFLDRPLDTLLETTDTSGRPLLAEGKEAIAALYRQRHALYEKYADITPDNATDAKSCVNDIINRLEDM